jgi:hypothetical protein
MQRPGNIMQTARNELSKVEQARRAKAVERQQFRPWREGDVYAPHDLSHQEMKKWSKHRAPKSDVFDVLNMNPLDEYKVGHVSSQPVPASSQPLESTLDDGFHDVHGPNQAPAGDWLAARQPAEDCKGNQAIHVPRLPS